jgi:hypothetical protein
LLVAFIAGWFISLSFPASFQDRKWRWMRVAIDASGDYIFNAMRVAM